MIIQNLLKDGEAEPNAEGFFKYLEAKSSKEFPFQLIKPTDKQPIPPYVTQETIDRWVADGIVIWEMVRQKQKRRFSFFKKSNKG